MNKKFYLVLIIILLNFSVGNSIEIIKNGTNKEDELRDLRHAVSEAKSRINGSYTYRWKDTLRFLPEVSVSRRAPHDQMNSPDTETYVSASVTLSQFYDVTDIAERREREKRKAIRRVESLGYSIEKLIERKYLLTDQIWKMKQIARSTEEPIEAAARQEKADQLVLQQNETFIEIERLYAEIEYVCVEAGG
jgi:hypothetical protein